MPQPRYLVESCAEDANLHRVPRIPDASANTLPASLYVCAHCSYYGIVGLGNQFTCALEEAVDVR